MWGEGGGWGVEGRVKGVERKVRRGVRGDAERRCLNHVSDNVLLPSPGCGKYRRYKGCVGTCMSDMIGL